MDVHAVPRVRIRPAVDDLALHSSPWQAMRRRHHQEEYGIGTSVGGSAGSPEGEMFQEILCAEEKHR